MNTLTWSWHFFAQGHSGLSLKSLLRDVVRTFLYCSMAILVGSRELGAQSPVLEQDKVRLLAKFSEFVKWPAGSGAPVTIGILGDDSFGALVDKMNVVIKRSKRAEDLKGCQVVFVAKSEVGNIDAIVESLEGANVLTVGESEGFAKQGGVIGFVTQGEGVRFEINTAAARRAGLGIDLRLLKLALHVFNS